MLIPFLRFCGKIYLVTASFLAFLFLLGYEHQFVLFLSNVRLFILLPAITIGFFLILRSPCSRWTILTFIGALGLPYFLFLEPEYCAGDNISTDKKIHVMTLNLAGSSDVPGRNLNDFIENNEIDVLSLQEVTPNFWKTEGKSLKAILPYEAYRASPEGYWTQALLSRYPIESTRVLDPGPGFSNFDSRLVLEVSLMLHGMPFSIQALHLSVPFYRGPCRGLHCLLVRYDQSQRDRQLEKSIAWSQTKDHPTILLGDLNLSDQNPEYERLYKDSIDAGRCSDDNPATWPADNTVPVAFTRIDYALIMNRKSVPILANSRTFRIQGTDHIALVARFLIPEPWTRARQIKSTRARPVEIN